MSYLLLFIIILIIVALLMIAHQLKLKNYIFGTGEVKRVCGGKLEFTMDEIEFMKKIIKNNEPIPPTIRGISINDSKPIKQHIEHCFCQLSRFATEAKETDKFRTAQFCLNLGRVQEMLKSIGGVKCWWRVFEPLIENKKYEEIIEVTKQYLELLDLPIPDKAKMDNKCS